MKLEVSEIELNKDDSLHAVISNFSSSDILEFVMIMHVVTEKLPKIAQDFLLHNQFTKNNKRKTIVI